MSHRITSILLTGVGGQGVLLASEIIAHAAFQAGLDVKKSELHGMAQRGGSVVSHLRFGAKVYSPLIAEGEADFILAFEQLEALRFLTFLKEKGTVIYNSQCIVPLSSYTMSIPYPEAKSVFEGNHIQAIKVNAIDIARQLGDVRLVNTIMLGVISHFLPFDRDEWLMAIKTIVRTKFVEINNKAFDKGKSILKGDIKV